MGVAARLFVPAPGMGVPLFFRGRPRGFGVLPSLGSFSIDSRRGTVLVIVRRLNRRPGVEVAEGGDWNNLRRVLLPAIGLLSSSPFRREEGDTKRREDWLRVMRRDAEEGGSEATSAMVKSLRGSGDDMVQGRSRCDEVGRDFLPVAAGQRHFRLRLCVFFRAQMAGPWSIGLLIAMLLGAKCKNARMTSSVNVARRKWGSLSLLVFTRPCPD